MEVLWGNLQKTNSDHAFKNNDSCSYAEKSEKEQQLSPRYILDSGKKNKNLCLCWIKSERSLVKVSANGKDIITFPKCHGAYDIAIIKCQIQFK